MKRLPAVDCQSHKLAVVDYSARKNLIVASTTMNVSFHLFLSGFSKSFRRFPAAAFFFVLLTIFAIYELYDDDTVHFLMLYYPATAGMLNIVLRLLAESRKNDNRRLSNYLIDATVNVLWFAAALTFKDHFSLDIAWTISAAVIAFTICILIFLIPFCSAKPDDIGFWNHSLDTAVAFLISVISGAIFAAGLGLLLFAFHKLFDIEIDFMHYVSVVIFCITFIVPMIFLQFCPEPARESPGRTDRPGRNGLGLINYIFIPLVAAYLLTLYAYAVRIAIHAELPRGRVSMLVTISMACMLLLIFFLFPVQFRKDAPKFDKQVLKYLPAVFLPLLVFMSIGIGMRLHDYGVTIKRLYLLVFNIWCYAVCIWLTISRSRHIWIVPASFVAILFLTSVGPQNISSVTRRILVREVASDIAKYNQDGLAIPLDEDSFYSFIRSVESSSASRIKSKLLYLMETYPEDAVSGLIDSTVTVNIVCFARPKPPETVQRTSSHN
ncbi:MAG: DUF4153 domain-containing protein [Candidatus Cryptobacteroides sp.]